MLALRLLGVAVVLVVAGCGTDTGTPSTGTTEAAWSATFVQDRPDQDTPDAHVKLVNGDVPATVTGVRMRWPGYADGGFQPAEMDYAPGATHRLSIRLPTPRCESTPEDVPAVEVRLADGSNAVVELDQAGTTILRQVWDRQCGEQRLLDAVDVRFGDVWRPAGGGLQGEVMARRVESTAQAELVEVRGSVLIDLSLVGADRVLLPVGAEAGRLPVRVQAAGRCDAHSLSASSQTFTLRVWVSLGGGPEQSLVLRPDATARRQMTAMIRSSCGLSEPRQG